MKSIEYFFIITVDHIIKSPRTTQGRCLLNESEGYYLKVENGWPSDL